MNAARSSASTSFAGARFYFPGELGTILPRAKSIAIPECTIFERPDNLIRKVSQFWDGEYFEGKNPSTTINPAKNINGLRLRLESMAIPCCHGLNAMNYLERFKDRDEYFALGSNGKRNNRAGVGHPGQLCYTSGIREEIYQDAKTILSGKGIEKRPGLEKSRAWRFRWAHPGVVDIMPQDGFQPCQCPECKKQYTGEIHYASDLMWNLVAQIAGRLKKENIPGTVTMMGYRPYRRVPAVAIPDNVMVQVAQAGPWYMSDRKQHAQATREIKDWTRKLNHKVWLWNYACKLSTLTMPGIPSYTPRAVGHYYKEIAPWIFGAFIESESDRFLYMALNHYLFSRVMWNASIDPDAAVDEFYRLMFGPAAPEMKSALDRIENIWTRQIAGRVVETALGPAGAPPSDYDLWNKVYSPKVLKDLDGLFARAAAKTAPKSLERRRVELFRSEYLDRIKKAAAAYHEKSSAVKGLHFAIEKEFGPEITLTPFNGKGRQTAATRVAASFDGKFFTMRFRCDEPRMADVVANDRKPDDQELWKDSSIEIFLNPSGDRKNFYQFLVNAKGVLADQKLVSLGASAQNDYNWNSGAKAAVKPYAGGFEITVAIPAESLPGLQSGRFPANFNRNRILTGGQDYEPLYTWSPFVRGFHDYENFGTVGTDGRNLLANGDFSLPPAKWSRRHWGLWDAKRNWIEGWIGSNRKNPEIHALDHKVFFSAPASMRLSATGSVAYWSVKNLIPGKKYRLSCMVKLENVKPVKAGAGVVLNLQDPGNRWFPTHNWPTGTMDWTRLSFDFTARDTKGRNAVLNLRMMNATGTAWFDDVKIEQLPD